MIGLLASSPPLFFLFLITLLVAITIHEAAHAWSANRLGDPTAKLAGRLTLNPFAHLDPIGTLLLVLVGFGWGKPVPVDSYNLEDPRRDEALLALAGPASNILFAGLLGLIFRFVQSWLSPTIAVDTLLFLAVKINLSLGLFNLLPLYPLDGSKILIGLLPQEKAIKTEIFLKQYGFLLIFLSLFPLWGGNSLIGLILSPLINTFTGWLAPIGNLMY